MSIQKVEIHFLDLKKDKQRELCNLFHPDPIPHPVAILINDKEEDAGYDQPDDASEELERQAQSEAEDVEF